MQEDFLSYGEIKKDGDKLKEEDIYFIQEVVLRQTKRALKVEQENAQESRIKIMESEPKSYLLRIDTLAQNAIRRTEAFHKAACDILKISMSEFNAQVAKIV
jgi:hypothetical protein